MGRVAALVTKFPNLPAVVDEFLLFKGASGASKRTLEDYAYHLNRFLKRFPCLTDYRALEKAILEYFSEKAAPATRNTRLKCLRAFLNWCVSQGYLPGNPTAGLKRAKEDLEAVRHVPLEHLKKLLDQPDKRTYTGLRDYCLLLVQIDTGARPGELFQVKVSDLNLEARELYIRPEVAKTRVGRTLILSPFTAEALARFLRVRPAWWPPDVPLFATEEGRSLSRQHWARRVKQYCQRAGVNVTPYGLRHSFALEFLKGGGDPFSLQRILGHADLSMTRRYVRLAQQDIKEVHEKASPVTRLAQLGKRAGRRLRYRDGSCAQRD